MADFLEESLPINLRAGVQYNDTYSVEITTTAAGYEYRRLIHNFPQRTYTFFYTDATATIWDNIISLYHRAFGMYAGFRAKALDDYTTNNRTLSPTAVDQQAVLISGTNYQMQIKYGTNGTALPSIGYPIRTIFKPVAGTSLVAINTQQQTVNFSVDTTTGIITFTNKTKTISSITQASSAVITVGTSHGFLTNDSVYISGVAGMVQINNLRTSVISTTSTTITVNINSSAFTAYSSGGVVNTAPQGSEVVTFGCQYDIPVRFNSKIDIHHLVPGVRETSEIEIIELLNP